LSLTLIAWSINLVEEFAQKRNRNEGTIKKRDDRKWEKNKQKGCCLHTRKVVARN
jgi:hypothetical protein